MSTIAREITLSVTITLSDEDLAAIESDHADRNADDEGYYSAQISTEDVSEALSTLVYDTLSGGQSITVGDEYEYEIRVEDVNAQAE